MKRFGTQKPGFTLIELMVVISIIALTAALVLPTVGRIFAATSDEQARTMLSAVLGRARAAAIENAECEIVHIQIGKQGSSWACAMSGLDRGSGMKFGSEGIVMPYRIPGHVAFGGIAARFLLADGYHYKPNLTDTELEDFTNFTIGFSPAGQVITSVDGAPFALDAMTPVFGMAEQAIWETCPAPEFGVRAAAYFPYPHLRGLPAVATKPNEVTRTMYLHENAQFLALNPLTGRVMQGK